MIERFTEVSITIGSIWLFGYWFRYTCLLILSAASTREYARQVAIANQLNFPEISSAHHEIAVVDLDLLCDSLDRDYVMITSLLKYVAPSSGRRARIEECLLKIYYRLMRARYSVSRRFSTHAAHQALQEMLLVVAHFANSMDGCAA